MHVKPLGDRVLVERIEARQEMKGGIVIPDTAKEKPQEAKVLAVGDGRLDESGDRVPLDVAAGDRVLISRYGGTEVDLDGEERLILKEDDILAILEG